MIQNQFRNMDQLIHYLSTLKDSDMVTVTYYGYTWTEYRDSAITMLNKFSGDYNKLRISINREIDSTGA